MSLGACLPGFRSGGEAVSGRDRRVVTRALALIGIAYVVRDVRRWRERRRQEKMW